MISDPYKTPESELEINDNVTHFYVISINKFTALFFSTLGIYSIYWFYKNWANFKLKTSSTIWPVARAIFSVFFTHSLFSEVQDSLQRNNKTFDWNPKSLATTYVVLAVLSHIFDKMSMKEIASPIADLLSVLIIPLMYLPLLKAQKAINFSQEDIDGHSNETFTAANYFWIVMGILLWLITLFGMLVLFDFINID